VNGTMGELPSTRNDGLIYRSKLLWALGNYSRFIRPGMIRVEASLQNNTDPATAAANLMLSAYKNPATQEWVAVVVNMSNTDEKISLSGIPFAAGQIASYTTSASQELKFAARQADAPISIGAQSIVTLTGKYQ